MTGKTLDKRFEDALQKFVEKQKKNPNVIGIILSGSFLHSDPDKNSDLDVYVVTKSSEYRERGNTWVNGVEVEYLKNPVKQIEDYFDEEYEGKTTPSTAHMFVNSRILYKKGRELDKLMKQARRVLNKKKPPMSKLKKELERYRIDDLEKDLEDAYLNKDYFTFNYVAIKILESCLNIFYDVKRVEEEKPKRLYQYLKSLDKKFADLYKDALIAEGMKRKYDKTIKLVRYIESFLGGKRPKEWKLRSKCPYLDKENWN